MENKESKIKNCVICGKEIPEKRIKQGKKTCCVKCQCRTSESRERRRQAARLLWQNSTYRTHCIEGQIIAQNKPEVKAKRDAAIHKAYENIDLRQKISERTTKALANEVSRELRRSVAKNLWLSNDYRQKVSSSIKIHHNETLFKIKQSNTLKNTHKNHGKEIQQKRYETMKKNGSYSKSKWELYTHELLLTNFDKEDIERQYFDKERYPFNCDFYIKSLDLFIECHYGWHHNKHPFDSTNQSDLDELTFLQEKAKDSRNYKNKIYQWTDLDVRKAQCAKDNKLNWIAFYSIDEFKRWLITYK